MRSFDTLIRQVLLLSDTTISYRLKKQVRKNIFLYWRSTKYRRSTKSCKKIKMFRKMSRFESNTYHKTERLGLRYQAPPCSRTRPLTASRPSLSARNSHRRTLRSESFGHRSRQCFPWSRTWRSDDHLVFPSWWLSPIACNQFFATWSQGSASTDLWTPLKPLVGFGRWWTCSYQEWTLLYQGLCKYCTSISSRPVSSPMPCQATFQSVHVDEYLHRRA